MQTLATPMVWIAAVSLMSGPLLVAGGVDCAAGDLDCAADSGLYLLQTNIEKAPLVRVGSDNGNKYECDAAKLVSERKCYFIATAKNDIGGADPHDINQCIAEDGKRKVVNSTGDDLAVTPKPWQNGDNLVASETELAGDQLLYSKAFEMMAPLRDLMMYDPQVLDDNNFLWEFLTRPLKDCSLKEHDEMGDHGVALNRDNVYTTLKDTDTDSHHKILQFLEEGSIDLVCAMTSNDSLTDFSRCKTVREASSYNHTCWEAAYADFRVEVEGSCGEEGEDKWTTAAPSVTAAPEPSPEPQNPCQGKNPNIGRCLTWILERLKRMHQ